MSTLKVDTILKRTGTGTITVGQSGDTISIPSGATLTVAGSTITAAGTNTPAFRAYLSSQQSITNGAYTKVIYQAEDFDTDSAYDTSNGRFTVPSDGKYLIMVNIYLYQNNEFQRLHILDNDVVFAHNSADYKTGDGDIGQDVSLSCTAIRHLSSGDYITFMMLGGGTDRIYMGGAHSHCAIHKLS